MIKLVIFDFDGVLVDSNEAWIDILNQSSLAAGVDKKVTYDDIKPHYGRPVKEIFKITHPGLRHDRGVMDVMYKNFVDFATKDEFVGSIKAIRGIKSSLKELGKEYVLAVGSANSKRLINRILGKLGLLKYFDIVVSGNDVSNGKPSPDMVLKIIDHFGVSPAEAVYVGDSRLDIIMAKRAKVKSVVFLTGILSRQQAEQLKPNFIVHDASQLQEVISCM